MQPLLHELGVRYKNLTSEKSRPDISPFSTSINQAFSFAKAVFLLSNFLIPSWSNLPNGPLQISMQYTLTLQLAALPVSHGAYVRSHAIDV